VKKIKALLFDVDGVLTDGTITLDARGEELKTFNVRDGQLIQFIHDNLFVFGVISGRSSLALKSRLNEMKIAFCRLGITDKMKALRDFIQLYNIDADDIGYIGDDLIDIEVMKSVDWSFAPSDACSHVLGVAKTITSSKGRNGVLREVTEMIIAENVELVKKFNNNFRVS